MRRQEEFHCPFCLYSWSFASEAPPMKELHKKRLSKKLGNVFTDYKNEA